MPPIIYCSYELLDGLCLNSAHGTVRRNLVVQVTPFCALNRANRGPIVRKAESGRAAWVKLLVSARDSLNVLLYVPLV